MNNDEMLHYASPYYDPVKAHEYYMKNRELKGRRSTSKLNDEGKKVWSCTKEQIKTEKTASVEGEKGKRDKQIEETRAEAAAVKQRITEKLKELNTKLSEKLKADQEALAEKTKRERQKVSDLRDRRIKNLQSQAIPTGVSKERRAQLVAARSAKIASLRSDAQNETGKISASNKQHLSAMREETSQEKSKNQNDAKSQREEVSTKLKAVIQAAREAYKQTKTNLDSSYENLYQQEYDKILSEYGKGTGQSEEPAKSVSTTTGSRLHRLRMNKK